MWAEEGAFKNQENFLLTCGPDDAVGVALFDLPHSKKASGLCSF